MKRKIVALFLQFTIAMNTRNKKGGQQSEIIKALKMMASYSFWDRLLKLGPETSFFSPRLDCKVGSNEKIGFCTKFQ